MKIGSTASAGVLAHELPDVLLAVELGHAPAAAQLEVARNLDILGPAPVG